MDYIKFRKFFALVLTALIIAASAGCTADDSVSGPSAVSNAASSLSPQAKGAELWRLYSTGFDKDNLTILESSENMMVLYSDKTFTFSVSTRLADGTYSKSGQSMSLKNALFTAGSVEAEFTDENTFIYKENMSDDKAFYYTYKKETEPLVYGRIERKYSLSSAINLRGTIDDRNALSDAGLPLVEITMEIGSRAAEIRIAGKDGTTDKSIIGKYVPVSDDKLIIYSPYAGADAQKNFLTLTLAGSKLTASSADRVFSDYVSSYKAYELVEFTALSD